jgi:vacuolar-type H+-ATPase subunit E/Vma4
MGLAELVTRLDRDVDARIAAIRDRARADADAIEAEARRQAMHTQEEALAARRGERRARLARELAVVRRRARLEELVAKRALIDRVLARVGELLETAETNPAYLATLARQVDDALRYVSDRPSVVRCRPSLASVVRAAVAGRDGVVCVEQEDAGVGFAIHARDGSVDIDETLAARLERSKKRLAVRLAAEVDA